MTSTITMSNYIFNTNTDIYSKLVYAAIKKFSDNKGHSFPSRNTLAQLCNMSLSTLRKAINTLVDANVLNKKFRYRENKSQTSNLYILTPFMMSGDYYFRVRADIFELNLSEKETVVYMYLCSCANSNSECYPSIRQISTACGIGQTSVKIALKGLVERELIIKFNQFREDGGKRNNLYKIVSATDNEAASVDGEYIAEPNKEEKSDLTDNEELIFVERRELGQEQNINNTNKENKVSTYKSEIHVSEITETLENSNAKLRGDIFDFKLSKDNLMVYLYIKTCNELKTGKYPLCKQIASYCKITVSKTEKAIFELMKLGLIDLHEQETSYDTMVITKPPPWSN